MINIKTITKCIMQPLQTVFVDIRSAIVGTIALSFLSTAGILLIVNKVWNGLQTPIPLWLVIVISLSVLCCCVILFQIHSYRTSNKPMHEIKYFPIGNYKWKATIFKNGTIRVDEYPLCAEHDLRFIYDSGGKHCPYIENFRKCTNRLSDSDGFRIYQSAQSFIEREIRNKNY